ncbi:MAG: hypothetical protein WC781_03230 [Candidatus Pacearchaeota archaeon]|jgi:hypothetical protein
MTNKNPTLTELIKESIVGKYFQDTRNKSILFCNIVDFSPSQERDKQYIDIQMYSNQGENLGKHLINLANTNFYREVPEQELPWIKKS